MKFKELKGRLFVAGRDQSNFAVVGFVDSKNSVAEIIK